MENFVKALQKQQNKTSAEKKAKDNKDDEMALD
jgi:hypothetical protein